MSSKLEDLKREHPEWCFRCGLRYAGIACHRGDCETGPVIAALVAALEEVAENDENIQASLLKEGYEVGDGEPSNNALFDLIVDFEHAEAERDSLRAQLTANKAVRTAAEGALEEALRSFMCTQDPTIYPAGHWSHRALAIRAALKGGSDADLS